MAASRPTHGARPTRSIRIVGAALALALGLVAVPRISRYTAERAALERIDALSERTFEVARDLDPISPRQPSSFEQALEHLHAHALPTIPDSEHLHELAARVATTSERAELLDAMRVTRAFAAAVDALLSDTDVRLAIDRDRSIETTTSRLVETRTFANALILHARLLASDTLGFDDDERALDQLDNALDLARFCDRGGVVGALIRVAVEGIVFDAAAELAATSVPAELVLARFGGRLEANDTANLLHNAVAFELAFLHEHPPTAEHRRACDDAACWNANVRIEDVLASLETLDALADSTPDELALELADLDDWKRSTIDSFLLHTSRRALIRLELELRARHDATGEWPTDPPSQLDPETCTPLAITFERDAVLLGPAAAAARYRDVGDAIEVGLARRIPRD